MFDKPTLIKSFKYPSSLFYNLKAFLYEKKAATNLPTCFRGK